MKYHLDYIMITPSYPPRVGGVERHVFEVHSALRRSGAKGIIVVANEMPTGAENSKDTLWFPCRRLFGCLPKTSSLPMSLKLMRIFWKWNPKVIHFHDTIIYPVLPFLSSLGLLKKTYITFHGWEGVCPPMPRVVNRRRKIASAIKGSIAIGAFIEKWYGTKSNYISYGGVDVERYGMIKQSGCDPNELRIGYFGRFEPDTGLLEVVEAVQNCNRQLNQKVRLDLYGAGSLRDRLCALNEEEAVVTPLPIAKDPSAVLAKYSIVIASGYLTILEALCAERIVFAQYNNELREDYLRMHPAASSIFICKETGDFVAGILRCLSDPAGVAAKSKVGWDWAKRQSWEKVAATYTELWRL